MSPEERVARHRRLAANYLSALADGPKLGRIEFPPEWVIRPGTIQWLPSAMGAEGHDLGTLLAEKGITHGERGTAEFRKFWTKMPDFGLVAHGEPIIDETGFAVWIRLEGTTADGVKHGMWEFDIVRMDTEGTITRFEALFDMGELRGLLAVVTETTGDESMDKIRAKLA
jgi:hypothetical protein